MIPSLLARARGLVLYAAAALGLVSLLVAFWAMSYSDSAEAAAWSAATRSANVGDAAQAVLQAALYAETTQRRYLFTAEEDDLAAYRLGVARLPSQLRHLERATRDDAEQQRQAAQVRRLVDARLSLLESTVTVRREQGLQAAADAVRNGSGTTLTTELGQATGRLQAAAAHAAQVHARQAEAASEQASAAGTRAAMLLVALLVTMIAVLVHRGRLGRRHDAAVAERLQLADELARLTTRDSLTGLPNRGLLEDRIDRALTRAARDGTLVGLVFLDLDRFHEVNSGAGRTAGDQLLVEVARRLSEELRATDTLARVGADQFVALCERVGPAEDLNTTAERLRAAVDDTHLVQGGRSTTTTASAGLVLADHERIRSDDAGAATAGSLLTAAETAMSQAKERGGACAQWYDARGARLRSGRHELLADLRAAAAAGDQVWVAYQPLVDLDSEELVGVEALIRWEHPARGSVSPAEFVPLAEETGLIVALGEQVLRDACRQGAAWNRRRAARGLPPLRVSVNVSARQLLVPRFAETVRAVLDATRLAAGSLTLEITESVLVEGAQGAARQLQELTGMGVTLALDDFGTGYSSLSYLRQFPIGLIKIDGSFVQGLGRAPADEAIVRSVVALGKNLRRPVLAEGIETAAQARQLRDMGCPFGQGFHYGRPLPAAALEALVTPAAAVAV